MTKLSSWKQLSLAIKIASDAHHGQRDKGGKPYILHPLRLMHKMSSDDYELMSIAVLHDVVEDTQVKLEDLRIAGFSERVLLALDILTHDDEDSYDNYISIIGTNLDAIKVKMADLEDNSDLTRLKGVKQKDFERMKKYHRSYVRLKEYKTNLSEC